YVEGQVLLAGGESDAEAVPFVPAGIFIMIAPEPHHAGAPHLRLGALGLPHQPEEGPTVPAPLFAGDLLDVGVDAQLRRVRLGCSHVRSCKEVKSWRRRANRPPDTGYLPRRGSGLRPRSRPCPLAQSRARGTAAPGSSGSAMTRR